MMVNKWNDKKMNLEKWYHEGQGHVDWKLIRISQQRKVYVERCPLLYSYTPNVSCRNKEVSISSFQFPTSFDFI